MIVYLIEANVLIAVFYGLFELAARSGKNLRLNRVGYISVALLALIIPFINFEILANSVQLPLSFTLNEIIIDGQVAKETSVLTWENICFAILGIVLCFGVIKTLHLVYQINRLEFKSKDGLFLNEEGEFSFSFFNYIVLKKDLSLTEKEIVFYHEAYHSKKGHSLDVLFINLLQGLFLINPAYYLLRASMQLNHEYLADDASAKKFGSYKYATCVMAQSLDTQAPIIYNTFSSPNKSASFKRLNMLNQKNQTKMKKLIYVLMLPMFFATGVYATVQYQNYNLRASGEIIRGDKDVNQAEYVGGHDAMVKFIQETVVYPEEAKKTNAEGTAFVALHISENGKIESVDIKRTSGNEFLDAEAIRAVSLMPDWKPATKDGNNVASEFILPISFKL